MKRILVSVSFIVLLIAAIFTTQFNSTMFQESAPQMDPLVAYVVDQELSEQQLFELAAQIAADYGLERNRPRLTCG